MNANQQIQYVLPDGRFTLQGMQLIEALLREIEALQARVTALEP